MSLSTIDGTFYRGKPIKIESVDRDINGVDWEMQECINDAGLVYYRLWIKWNDITTKDYYTAIRKQTLTTLVIPYSQLLAEYLAYDL